MIIHSFRYEIHLLFAMANNTVLLLGVGSRLILGGAVLVEMYYVPTR